MDVISEKAPDSQTNYVIEDIPKLEELISSDEANMKKLEADNAVEKEGNTIIYCF